MRTIVRVLLAALAAPAIAGDLWEITSTTAGPDGNPLPYTDKKCLPKDGMNAAQMLDGMGDCKFDEKSGDAAAMTFSMTCRLPGVPAGLPSMKVSGDARLAGDKFDMRYVVTPGGGQSPGKGQAAGDDFSMSGSAAARKIGSCDER